MSLSKPTRDHSKSLIIDFDKMTIERMLELLILQGLLPRVGNEYKKNKMLDRFYELRTEFLKPYRI